MYNAGKPYTFFTKISGKPSIAIHAAEQRLMTSIFWHKHNKAKSFKINAFLNGLQYTRPRQYVWFNNNNKKEKQKNKIKQNKEILLERVKVQFI